jgi:3,4-dihydroxy 2-butanone 4-phosphate synthase/GTP cyclohydrolase II
MRMVAAERAGIILYLRQEGRGIGLEQKLRAYNLQDSGYDTVDANLLLGHQADEREYSAAAAILSDLGVSSIRLMTNNPAKIDHLSELGVQVRERVPLASTVNPENAAYLSTKVARMRHLLSLTGEPAEGSDRAVVDPLTAAHLAELKERAQQHFARSGRPFVTLSYAQSLNGVIGTSAGGPLALSCPDSRVVTHALRAAHDAILVGIGTVLADDPLLTVRLVEGVDPQPIVLDSRLRFPAAARLLANTKRPWIAHVNGAPTSARALAERDARLLALPENRAGEVDLGALLVRLGEEGIQSVMVEGGARVIAGFIASRLVDFVVITITPHLTPGQHPAFDVLDATSPSSLRLAGATYSQAGTDVMVWSQVNWQSSSSGIGAATELRPTPT